ncbi:uncharacterized protein EI97DRAFT_242070 [Westerdykella ornata]|uniref:Ankyrin n=1 Tax=Westerdykella ornata TaxID=318751 RepID=A0A6A6J6M9_WESOR|nr:uncharacterized protein EI97DRAFT_242070 [Westerdykella ornata]KAF2271874.1 hypothetical protein EI97DRAFT_242070 [Westerdykella ornata]
MDYAGLQLWKLDDDCLDCSERMRAVMLKSEERLDAVLADIEYAANSKEDGYSLYEMATFMEWREGLERIFQRGVKIEAGLELRPNAQMVYGRTLLEMAVSTRNVDIVNFWLETRRQVADMAELESIGSLESALDRADSYSKKGMRDAVLLELVNQRRSLRQLADRYLLPGEYTPPSEGALLDSQAQEVIDMLVKRGVDVKKSLRPARLSVFHQADPSIDILDMLYEAGFRDTAPKEDKRMVSPLLWMLTYERRRLRDGIFNIAEWFLRQGSTLTERWPNSGLTVHHFMAWRRGQDWFEAQPAHVDVPPWSYLVEKGFRDSCRCLCSEEGCGFLTMLWKGMAYEDMEFEYEEVRKKGATQSQLDERINTRLDALARWIDAAFQAEMRDAQPNQWEEETKYEKRWLGRQFFRLAAFEKLGLRHTCCNPGMLQHDGRPIVSEDESVEREKQIGPLDENPERMTILEEDEETDETCMLGVDTLLRSRLESLTRALDGLYAGRPGSLPGALEDFLWVHAMFLIDDEMERVRAEELKMFAEGRRELGILMDMDEDTETESEDEVDSDVWDSEEE